MNAITKVLGFVRAIFDTKYSCEYFIKNVEDSFYKYQKTNPGHNQHFYLANTWLTYMSAKGADINDPNIQMTAPTTTYLIACVEPEYCARTLGIFLQFRERPETAEQCPNLTEEFNKVMQPVIEAQQNGTTEELYKKYNPKMKE